MECWNVGIPISLRELSDIVFCSGDCESRQSLAGRGGGEVESLCEEIPGDTPLYSMIRVWSRPVSCPLQGPHSVAYGKGGANKQCSHPPSLMDSCTDQSVIQVILSSLSLPQIFYKIQTTKFL